MHTLKNSNVKNILGYNLSSKSKKDTVIITVRLPRLYVEYLDKLVENSVFMSRGECVRFAIKELINEEFQRRSRSKNLMEG